jgi:hypothetical protein
MNVPRIASRHIVVSTLSALALVLVGAGGAACASGGDSGAESGGQDLSAASKAGGLKKGEICQLSDDATPCASGLACASNCPADAKCIVSIFTCQETAKPPVTVIGEGGVCQPGSAAQKCDDGLECADNCPKNAKCIVSIFTCQKAPEKIKQGGVCGLDSTATCADGLSCKDNCPADAKCFVSIFTCQPD